jgi:hypothetical protein
MTGKQPKDTQSVQHGYLHVARCQRTGYYKIGSARRPDTRARQLTREMSSPVVLLHTIATNQSLRLEREAQARVMDSHIGGEWFVLDEVQLAVLCSVSSVWYRDEGQWVPRSRSRIDFDSGAAWARRLPVCGALPAA